MKAWIKDGRPAFFPIKGSVPAGDVIETVDAHDSNTHEPGPVIGATIENGVVKVRRMAKVKDSKKVLKERLTKDATKANTVAELKAIVRDIVSNM